MNTLKYLVLSALLMTTVSLYGFERGGGGRGGHENFNRGHENFNRGYGHDNFRHNDYNPNVYQGGGYGGGNTIQPNSSFEQLEQYANPNSAANQNFQYNQRQQQQGGY